MEKQCLCCQEIIIGRSDKKFCGDACRNDYHNKVNSQNGRLFRKVNNELKRNYLILNRVWLVEGKGKVTKVALINQGFQFDLFTSVYQTKKGSEYHFVYDLGYLKLGEDLYMVVKKY